MKDGIKTSEFWLTIVFAVAKTLLPDLPEEAFYAVLAYIGSRVGIKLPESLKQLKKG